MTFANPDRRAILWGGTSLGLCSIALPGSVQAVMQAGAKFSGKPFGQLFKPTAGGFGMVGPWGEVRASKLAEGLTPYLIQTANKAGLFDYTGRKPFVSLQGSTGEIRLTPDGVGFGKAKPVPWNKASVSSLKNALKNDRKAMQSAMQMRSAMATSFAAVAVATKSAPPKQMAESYGSIVEDLGRAAICTTTTITETATSFVERTINEIQTAAERYAECYDDALRTGVCRTAANFSLPAGQVCAAGYCTAKGFVDVVIGIITIVTEVVEEVTREVISCTSALAGRIPNEWNLPDLNLPTLPMKALDFGAKDVVKALEFIKEFSGTLFGFLGPYGKCLIDGKWSIEKLGIPFIAGVGIPYGVKVCISASCANSLAVQNVVGESLAAWGSALGALAALSPQFAASVSSIGITATPAIAAAVAALPAAVVSAMAIILAFIIMALLYASAIAVQLGLLIQFNPAALADGEVCIVHPSIALAAIKAATIGSAPAELVPPIVIG